MSFLIQGWFSGCSLDAELTQLVQLVLNKYKTDCGYFVYHQIANVHRLLLVAMSGLVAVGAFSR